MVRIFSLSSSTAYQSFIKPVLFRQPPDVVHSRLLKLSALYQRLPFSVRIVNKIWAYHNDAILKQTVDGITFHNPVGLSAGFDKNIELLPTMQSIGYGFMTGGSVTYKPCEGNPRPWFYRLPKSKSLIVNVGLANQGAERIRRRIETYKAKWFTEFPLIVSVAKTNNSENCNDDEAIADYVGSLEIIRDEERVAVYELNISCPNAYGGEPFTTPKRLDKLLTAVDALFLTKPVWVKMPINLSWQDFNALLQVIVKHHVTTVVIGNLNKQRSGDQLKDTIPAGTMGNLSGLPTQKLSNDLIAKTYRKYHTQLTIVGVGGIFSAEDAYRKICLGASLVGLVTGMIFKGPQLIGQINNELAQLVEKEGFQNISEAIGSYEHQKLYS